MGQNPDKSPHLTGEQKIQLIDSNSAIKALMSWPGNPPPPPQIIANRVSVVIPGQTWKFNDDSFTAKTLI